MKRIVLRSLVVAGAISTAAAAAPHILRHLPTFKVRRVEVTGTRYLLADEALGASGITGSSNLFQDLTEWRAALERHPLIDSVRIERVFPYTIRLRITEAKPIALIATPELRVITAEGELLPVDPTEVDLDLPVITTPIKLSKGRVRDEPFLEMLGALARLQKTEPVMFGWISDAEPVPHGVRVRLRSPAGAEALIPMSAEPLQLYKLRLALAHLSARRDIRRLVRIDARFRDQIVVTLTSTAAS
jgi:POTRA domain-containing FtsQ-type protein